MKKFSLVLIAVLLLCSIVVAAVISEYFRDEREIVIEPWMSFEVNHDPMISVFGTATLHDYINITPYKEHGTTVEIKTEIYFNSELLENPDGIYIDYSKETGSGTLILAPDYNNNGYPEAAIFGTNDLDAMGDPDGSFTIRRNMYVDEDLERGTYRIVTILIPYQGSA